VSSISKQGYTLGSNPKETTIKHRKLSNKYSLREAARRATFRRMVKRPTGRKEDDMQNNGEDNKQKEGRYAEQWRREQTERRMICRTTETRKGRKEDDMQNNGK
jgi:hypothetical protein